MSSKTQRRGSDYRRKRKRFHNNQYTRKVPDKLDVDCISASAKKLCKESDLDKEVDTMYHEPDWVHIYNDGSLLKDSDSHKRSNYGMNAIP
ncbi:hypothetical protein TNCT_729031 [Trichonephila clavata]|uniref:Uncharacterized protein n=1 Tax=Trichonephila clavata TaxID=2740835 RepID=A0A8X6IHL8_TRICU|nr:hypothetical protein TNCT_729031 [Trichonephila clavata]